MSTTVSHSQALRFIWRYVRRSLPALVLMLALSLSGTAATLAQPFFYKTAVDAIANGHAHDYATAIYAVKMIALGILMVCITLTAEQASNFLLSRIEAPLMVTMHSDVFAKAQRLSSHFHVNEFAGSTARKITRGIDSVETILDRFWQNFLPAIILTIGFFVVLSGFAPVIGIALFIGMILYAIIAIWLNLIMAKYYSWADRQDTRVTGSLVDALMGNSLVKSFAAEQREDKRHGGVVSEWKRRQLIAWSLSTGFVLIQFYYLVALEAIVLLLSVWLWYRGQFTPGSFIVVTFYVWQLWARLFEIGRHLRDYLRAMAHIEEMVEIVERPFAVADKSGAPILKVMEGNVDFDGVTFRYENQNQTVFKDFSLAIKPGEKVALVGHSGGGKSTFVKLLLRLYDIEKGIITIDSQNIADVTQESLRQSIGLVPQDPILFHRSIRENIAYGRVEATDEEIVHAAKLAHAHEFIEKLPKGYHTLVGERGVKLSGGERQRVAIARAILADKPILVLDEATSSLDSLSEMYIQEALEHLMKGRTTIVIAHRLSTIKKVDRIVVIEAGNIVEEGTHADLLAKEGGLYRNFYELQAGGFLGE